MGIHRFLLATSSVLLGATLFAAAPASASEARPSQHTALRGITAVTTAPGVASALIREGVLPLPVPPARFSIGHSGGLTVTYGFPITGGNPNLAGPSGDIFHAGGINFVSLRGRHLEIGRFDIALATGKIFATQVNFAPARIPVLDLDLAKLTVAQKHGATVLSGITLRLDTAAAQALNSTFGLSLPTDGSLVFATATVTLRS